MKFFDARKVYNNAVAIDWNTKNVISDNQSATTDEAKKKHQDKNKSAHWVSSFIGAEKEGKKDVAKLTGLKVVLGGEDKGKR